MEQNAQPVFGIEKLYVKDISVEVPNAPEIFLEREAPQVEIQLNSAGRGLGDGAYEVLLTVTVTAKLGEKTVFLVEVGQAGIFRVLNVPNEQIEPLIAVACPNILFPYARETVSDAVTRAGAQIGTPSFFINGRLLQGAQPFPAFKEAIDRALAE